jgi:hypothetical protein
MTITEFLEARIAEDEAAAVAAIDPEKPGAHWQWVTTETDTVVAPGDMLEALSYQPISLRSVEEFPTSAGMLPAFIIHQVLEMQAGAGDYIARWDPARVLSECAAKRAIIGLHTSETWSVPGPPPGDPHTYITESDNPNEVRVKRGGTFIGKISRAEFFERMGATKNPPAKELRALAAVYADHPDYDEDWAL